MPLKVAILDLESALPHSSSPLLQPRHDVLTVGTVLRQAGYDVEVYVEILNGLPTDRLHEFDVVGAAVTGPNYNPVKQFFARVREVNPRAILLAGGPYASVGPNDVLNIADIVVREEADVTIVELLAALEAKAPLDGIAGVSFKRDGRVIHNPRRQFLKDPGMVHDLSLLIGFKRLSLATQIFQYGGVYSGQAMTSRGCPFPCTFCYENMLGGTGFRAHAIEPFIADVKQKMEFFGIRHFSLADANFGTNPKHCREFLRAVIDADLGCKFTALCRVDIGHHPDILEMMSQAGFVRVSLGMEALEEPTLASIEKRQTVQEIVDSIARIRAVGIDVFGLFMIGFDDDNENTAKAMTRFCEENDVSALSIFCLTEYPGLPGRTIPRYRICETNLDYSGAHFVNTFPKRIRPSVLERSVYQALLRFYDPQAVLASLFGKKGGLAFQLGMFKQIRKIAKVSEAHQKELERIEAPYYDSQDRLRDDYLRAHPVLVEPLPKDLMANWPDPGDLAPRPLAPINIL
ncbi:MAG TPA: radical SAM protein [Thermoanaerobaculia bacterium]|nr:radical SAM protein [Thermoanaerobaculia bacterium]